METARSPLSCNSYQHAFTLSSLPFSEKTVSCRQQHLFLLLHLIYQCMHALREMLLYQSSDGGNTNILVHYLHIFSTEGHLQGF